MVLNIYTQELRAETRTEGEHQICAPESTTTLCRWKEIRASGSVRVSFSTMTSFPIVMHAIRAGDNTGITFRYEAHITIWNANASRE
jgi:hypothetical protein